MNTPAKTPHKPMTAEPPQEHTNLIMRLREIAADRLTSYPIDAAADLIESLAAQLAEAQEQIKRNIMAIDEAKQHVEKSEVRREEYLQRALRAEAAAASAREDVIGKACGIILAAPMRANRSTIVDKIRSIEIQPPPVTTKPTEPQEPKP